MLQKWWIQLEAVDVIIKWCCHCHQSNTILALNYVFFICFIQHYHYKITFSLALFKVIASYCVYLHLPTNSVHQSPLVASSEVIQKCRIIMIYFLDILRSSWIIIFYLMTSSKLKILNFFEIKFKTAKEKVPPPTS